MSYKTFTDIEKVYKAKGKELIKLHEKKYEM